MIKKDLIILDNDDDDDDDDIESVHQRTPIKNTYLLMCVSEILNGQMADVCTAI